jgi:hypothetical protein
MPLPFAIIQVTAAYSNAVLVAIMPHVSSCAKALDLPIPQPVTIAQVRHFGCSPRSDHIGGRVTLTNDYSFTFDLGQITLYTSPKSYYSLQDPARIPEFYGPVKIKAEEAIKIARAALKKLGYKESELHYDLKPQIKPPLKNEGHYVARYLIEWRDPERPDAGKFGIPFNTASVEVDASTGQIQMLSIHGRKRPDPHIDVHPPILTAPPRAQLVGGSKESPVSQAYARAFLDAILPQLSDFAKKSGIDVKTPILVGDVDMPHFDCEWEATHTVAVFMYLKTGDCFVYRHGRVIEFDAADAVRWQAPNSPPEDKPPEKFYGPVKMSSDEAWALVRKAVTQLDWAAQVPQLNKMPEIVPPRKDGANYFARYFFNWWPKDEGMQLAVAEVDATTKKIKSLGINDRANPGIWREPPKIDVPMGVKMSDQGEAPESASPGAPMLVPTLPPGMPLPVKTH